MSQAQQQNDDADDDDDDENEGNDPVDENAISEDLENRSNL